MKLKHKDEYKENLQFENENIDTKSAKKSNKGFVKELYPNQIYLFQIIDSFIQNNYVFQIDYLILDLYKEYQQCKCVLLPSKKECWGLVINEAASFGCPIISTTLPS